MTTENPLVLAGADRSNRRGGMKMTAQEWCDYGNAHLAEIGRSDVRWIVTGKEPRDHELVWAVQPRGRGAY